MNIRTKKYNVYINSFDWYLKRRAAIGRAGGKCQKCGTEQGLEVHHLTYERLGNELDIDLLVVCAPCHKKEDQNRQEAAESNRATRFYQARVDGWATKKYGEDWESYQDPERVEQEFDEWLERKEQEEW